MFRVMIVDDDDIERRGLAGLSVFPKLGMSVVAQAWDGSHAMELAAEFRPDIIISDIRMPVMDGLTFAAKVKVLLPVHIIMMSGYEDFEAAKQALSIGAHAYLTKPLKIEELEQALIRITGVLRADASAEYEATQIRTRLNALQPLLRERLLRDLLLGVRSMEDKHTRTEAVAAGLFTDEEKMAVILLESKDSAQPLLLRIQDTLTGMALALTLSGPIVIQGGTFAAVAFLPRFMNDEMAFDHLQQCAVYMLNTVKDGHDSSITISISTISDDESLLYVMYRQACSAMRFRSVYGPNRVYWYENESAFLSLPDISGAAGKIADYFRRNDIDGIIKVATAFFGDLQNSLPDPEALRRTCGELLLRLALTPYDKAENLAKHLADKKEACLELLKKTETEAALHDFCALFAAAPYDNGLKRRSRSDEIADRALAYIRQNFTKDISIDDIASQVYITPSHLRRVFKNVTGQTIQDCILAERMNKARELLYHTDTKIYDIALQTGYENSSYFNIVFKKYFGTAPGAYRSHIMSGGVVEAEDHDEKDV
jgi:YesN/AraC family two-component response regulator